MHATLLFIRSHIVSSALGSDCSILTGTRNSREKDRISALVDGRAGRVDMQVFPLPIEDDSYDAVNFIGALTYFETNEILRELCRVVRSGGHVVFSQRDDIMRDQDYGRKLDEMEREGVWMRKFGTEPMPYLPNHPEYGEHIKVQYFVYEVA